MSLEDFNSQNEKSLEKQLEELQEQNQLLNMRLNRLESIFQNTTIGVYQTTPVGKVTEANFPLVKMLGYESLEDMQSHNLEDDELIEQRDRKIFKEKIENEGVIIGHETQWLKKNGERIYIRESARAIKDADGNIIFYEGTVEDITERKLKEIALLESEKKYRMLIELLPNGLVIHRDYKIVFANETIAKAVKVKRKEDLIGKSIFDYIHPDYHKLSYGRVENSTKNKSVAGLTEEIFITEAGDQINVEVFTFPFDINGETHLVTVVTDITERKIAENELRMSEITYRGMLNSINEAIFIQNLDGSFVDVNKTAEKVFGYEHNYFIGKSPIYLSASDKNNFDEINSKIEKSFYGEFSFLKFWGKRSDGTEFPSEVSLVPGLYFGKKVVIAVLRDISERYDFEQKLIASERKYKDLIDFAVGGILTGSPEGIITDANSYMCELLGRKREEIIGLHIGDGFFTQESLERSPLMFGKLIEGYTVINQRDIIRPDGSILPIEMHTKKMPDKSYQSIYHDISQRKISEQRILEAKEIAEKLNLHKEALLKAMPDILFTFNGNGDIIDFYSNITDLLLTAPENFLNKNIDEVLPPYLAEMTKSKIQRVLNTGKMVKYTYALEIEERNMHFDARMVYLNDDTALAVVRDITERMNLISDLQLSKIKAEESDKLKSAFLANMSHEIRTPMNAILGFTDLLKDDVTDSEKHEYLEIIENSCNQLLIILNDIIEISKIEAGIVTKKTDTFNFKDLLADIYSEMLGLVPKDRDLSLILEDFARKNSLICVTDKIKLKQIITNLISNALKFTEKGYVKFGYQIFDDSFIELRVSDTGLGISEDDIEKIFNRFVQIENKLSVSSSGSGLGLSICKAYSEILGGQLRVESEVNKGSTFYFKFPIISYS
ncbi:MAG: PAS domain S-box protein [Bacteroidales bacterium]|nr:PAS domain S-box protein [Bacteroidales bacterium]